MVIPFPYKYKKQINRFLYLRGDAQMSKQDEEVIRKIYLIVQRGNNVEIKRDREGNLKVFEVKKNIVAV